MGLRVRPRESPISPEAALPPPRSPSRPLHPPLASGAAPRALVAPAAPRATDEGGHRCRVGRCGRSESDSRKQVLWLPGSGPRGRARSLTPDPLDVPGDAAGPSGSTLLLERSPEPVLRRRRLGGGRIPVPAAVAPSWFGGGGRGCAEPLSSFGRFRKAWVQGGRTGLSGMGVGEGSAGPCALQGGGPGHRGAWRGLHSVPQAGPVASAPGSPRSRWHHHFQEGQGVLGLRSCLVCLGGAGRVPHRPPPHAERDLGTACCPQSCGLQTPVRPLPQPCAQAGSGVLAGAGRPPAGLLGCRCEEGPGDGAQHGS